MKDSVDVRIFGEHRFSDKWDERLLELVEDYGPYILGDKFFNKIDSVHIIFGTSKSSSYSGDAYYFQGFQHLYDKETKRVRMYMNDFVHKRRGNYEWAIIHDLHHLKDILDGHLVRIGKGKDARIKYKGITYNTFDREAYTDGYINQRKNRSKWKEILSDVAPWELVPFVMADSWVRGEY